MSGVAGRQAGPPGHQGLVDHGRSQDYTEEPSAGDRLDPFCVLEVSLWRTEQRGARREAGIPLDQIISCLSEKQELCNEGLRNVSREAGALGRRGSLKEQVSRGFQKW